MGDRAQIKCPVCSVHQLAFHREFTPTILYGLRMRICGLALCAATTLEPNDDKTTTPIKHVIIIVGENRSFDHIFGAYVPKESQSIFNILSQGKGSNVKRNPTPQLPEPEAEAPDVGRTANLLTC
jgi:phospholipase C